MRGNPVCNLKKLELGFIILGTHSVLKDLAYKCMHNFPPHLSCDLALPVNIVHYVRVKTVPLSKLF